MQYGVVGNAPSVCLALKSLGLLGVIPRKDKLGVGCLLEAKSTGQLVLGTGHLDRLVKVLDSLLDLALLQEQLAKGGNSNIALGVSYENKQRDTHKSLVNCDIILGKMQM